MDNFKVNDDENHTQNNIIKGKNAIDTLHKGISKENEKTINLKISDIYGVDLTEAMEIHINYHVGRIKKIVKNSEILENMDSTLENHFDFFILSLKIINGDITENGCLDIFINAVRNHSQYQKRDRYISFYN